MKPEDQAAFDRRWSLARDGFGLERDDEHGRYVHLDDAVAVLHAALAHRDAQASAVNQQMLEALKTLRIEFESRVDVSLECNREILQTVNSAIAAAEAKGGV